jgi:hypothetical protein
MLNTYIPQFRDVYEISCCLLSNLLFEIFFCSGSLLPHLKSVKSLDVKVEFAYWARYIICIYENLVKVSRLVFCLFKFIYLYTENSSYGRYMGWTAGNSFPVRSKFFSTSLRQTQHLGLPSLLCYLWPLSPGKTPITHFHLVPRSRMVERGVIFPSPYVFMT